MTMRHLHHALPWLLLALLIGSPRAASTQDDQTRPAPDIAGDAAAAGLQIHYLEIVTPDVEATCAALEAAHAVRFTDPIPELGAARTAPLSGGGRLAVRAPLREDEAPVIRPYVLVNDLEAAVQVAQAAGAPFAIPRMDIPGQGAIAIYSAGGVEVGLWEE